jgi:thymidylate synthase ThyX
VSYSAKVLADSIACDVRLTTLEVTMPRFILAEFNTHRMFSRNSASSRAIPVEKRIAQIRDNPFVPEAFAANKRGMQAGEALGAEDQQRAEYQWMQACDWAVLAAERLAQIGVHKQWANRLLEPFAWHTVIVTATEWDNFFALRISEHAQPEIRTVAELMRAAMEASTPVSKDHGEWHLPLVYAEDDSAFSDLDAEAHPRIDIVKVSVARCARVSYLTHDGKRDVDADLRLHDQLLSNGHMSPFEHAAKVGTNTDDEFVGNFRKPWLQYRKMLPGEAVYTRKP